jgi:hypothetical protein
MTQEIKDKEKDQSQLVSATVDSDKDEFTFLPVLPLKNVIALPLLKRLSSH